MEIMIMVILTELPSVRPSEAFSDIVRLVLNP